ncbi:hypothetical protein Cch01nite_21150 [Cellulomonas chitinilytica]|uniref:Permease n=1 Tax=Cellulomonas chitinilytica TaxID=398759 RepID=A0A919P4C9_9CELL|nr:hypothetical protein [Cellulomonas chitinilytica]GIG21391.1 hypothetical protein Cch01nite_21150 [Cellulomonas chitinilytica]
MQLATRAVVTAALAALVAVAGYFGGIYVAGAAGLLALVFAVGWPSLAGLPFRPGSTVVVALAGLGGVAVVHFVADEPYLRDLPVVLAGAIVLAFINELLRRDGRPRLVESVSGTVAGTAVAVAVTGWVATDRSAGGESLVVAGATALAVGSAVVALTLAPLLGAVVTSLAATAAGALAGALLPGMGVVPGAALGFAVGVLVAALHALFDRLPALSRKTAALAAVTLPVTVTGTLVYVVGRVLGG